jgi:hypothetical protein
MPILARAYDWGQRAGWCAAALSVPFWIYLGIFVAPDAQRTYQQQKEAAIRRESAMFCTKYVWPAGSGKHADCVQDLMDMRATDEQRVTAELDGFF